MKDSGGFPPFYFEFRKLWSSRKCERRVDCMKWGEDGKLKTMTCLYHKPLQTHKSFHTITHILHST